MDFVRGQKAKLSDITSAPSIEVGVAIAPGPGQSIDVSVFGLDGNGKLSDDRYFIFYNQKSSPCGSLNASGAERGYSEVFRIELSRLPATIKRMVFVATLDGNSSMSAIGNSRLELLAGGVQARFEFSGKDFGAEKAIMIAELYHKDVWRFATIGQGFVGGLSALLTHFGGEESSAAAAPRPAAPAPTPAPAAPPTPAPAAAPADKPKVSLSKVSLEKRGSSQKVDLTKGGGTQPFHINLNWKKPEKKGFFGFLAGDGADLDLGCMYRLSTGQKGVIQPLGGVFGSRTAPPYIFLDKDDRTGAAADGENMHLYRPDLIELLVIFALIYEGTDNFSTVDGRLTIKDDKGNEIFIPLNNPDSRKTFCAVASIRNDGRSLTVTKDELYFFDHKGCDEHYGFGFRWVAGSK